PGPSLFSLAFRAGRSRAAPGSFLGRLGRKRSARGLARPLIHRGQGEGPPVRRLWIAVLPVALSVGALVSLDDGARAPAPPGPGPAPAGAARRATGSAAPVAPFAPPSTPSRAGTETREPTAVPWSTDREVAAGLAFLAEHDVALFRRFMEQVAAD